MEADLEEEEEEEEEDEEEDEEDSVPVVVEANKAKDVAPPVGVSSSDFKEDDAPSPPKVSPVAASPSFPAAKPVHDDDDEDEDEDYNVQGSGAGSTGGSRGTGTSVGRDGGSGAGSISGVDDEDEEEEDYDDTSDVEDIDINSVITEPETPRPPVKPEKKPEVVVVAPPAPQPTKAPVDRGIPTAPTTVTTPPMIEVRSEKAPSTTEQPSSTSTTARAPIIGSGDRAGADPGSDVHIDDHKPEDRPTSFFAQPGILAGELLFLASSSCVSMCVCVCTLSFSHRPFPLCVRASVASGENFRPFPLGYPLESSCISAASFSHMASLLFPHPHPPSLLFFFACIGAANSI